MNEPGSGEVSAGARAVVSCRLTRSLTIATAREMWIDNETRAGGKSGVERACT